MTRKWLEESKWREIQSLVPVACTDILPLKVSGDGSNSVVAVGLILRETPGRGRKWCLVGGRLGHNESFHEAISREIYDALGGNVHFQLKENIQPDFVAEYFTEPRADKGFDPRQHAIGLTFCIPVTGDIVPGGEAVEFEWFVPGQLPSPEEFGFRQDIVVAASLARFTCRTAPVIK
jgi:ADP-ribose pyrophosphatase YjhB (NUDIX family)